MTKRQAELISTMCLFARNTAIQDLNVMIVCRHTGTKRDPRAWKIKNDTYNRLGDTWRNNFDWVLK